MITPRFRCEQTDASLILTVACPAVRAADVEIHVDNTLVSIHIAPYFLRLSLPAPVTEDDASSAAYDPAAGVLTLTLSKQTRGEHFPDLDLLPKLLAPRPVHPPTAPVIEVLASHDAQDADSDARPRRETHQTQDSDLAQRAQALSLDRPDLTHEQREILQAAANDWQLPQFVPAPTSFHTALQKPYGFLDAYTGYFRHVAESPNEANALGPDAETLSPADRRARRVAQEDAQWDEEHYMADYADPETIEELLEWEHPHLAVPVVAPFTEAENLAMLRLPRKEYLPTPAQTHSLYLTLATLLFAYAYDARTTQHDPTPESAWTICVLTPAFAALDPPPYPPPSASASALLIPSLQPSPAPALITPADLLPSYRRALAFPLHRAFPLADRCRADAARLLARGPRTVLRCLLELRALLDAHDAYYVYARIWLDDLCAWVAACASEAALHELGTALLALRIDKRALGWDIDALEAAVRATQAQPRAPDSDDESDEHDEDPGDSSEESDSDSSEDSSEEGSDLDDARERPGGARAAEDTEVQKTVPVSV
ncbi:hypothetical protein HETIRDRAFT_443514 [Heterobasidion irregulare TC 32-1]|uniref:CS domain-containing protein n=1 Tax=Heterobasidion irregulare (strain TC 32-1) TaxID=747525 RepID=W4KI47_HETIT|nr:uncharacterized protein HETIRDRAFT_443514 [Heterobasidion irregulare TC 32-1]ETW85517.1 hypothetical protein HETIRDRAFT_443514 [Heterobasidion irregulare TC 32-1]